MIHEAVPEAALHGVVETEPAGWAEGGHGLRPVPRDVAAELNVAARDRVRHPAGCELRFAPAESATGLTTGLLYPGDSGTEAVAVGLTAELAPLVE